MPSDTITFEITLPADLAERLQTDQSLNASSVDEEPDPSLNLTGVEILVVLKILCAAATLTNTCISIANKIKQPRGSSAGDAYNLQVRGRRDEAVIHVNKDKPEEELAAQIAHIAQSEE